MAEEPENKQDATEQKEAAPKKSKGRLPFILIGVVVFAVSVAGFSFYLGVFDQQNAEQTGTPDVEQTEVQADAKGSENESAPESLKNLKYLDLDLFDDSMIAEDGHDAEDSLRFIEWIKAEHDKIASQWQQLEDKEKQIEKREYKLKQLIEQKNQMESARIASLAKLYDGMKAQEVAPLINRLNDDQAVQVLLKMKSANAAKILGAISPDRAASLSSKMITVAEDN
jgi:flagellar motility protein MotE (MotC chaperone)